ncbi:MAG: ACT domain-containing protein [Gammaproteobacteria bacterium]|nr:ACT domain-containing protein [Gammaproteobacteria bacterium]
MSLVKITGKYQVIKIDKKCFDGNLLSSMKNKIFSIIFEDNWVSLILLSEDGNFIDGAVVTDEKWLGFKVDANISFDVSGVLLSFLSPLKNAGISVLAVSSFDTDYIFVRDTEEVPAIAQWEKSGISVKLSVN